MDRHELLLSVRDAKLLATMLAVHRRTDPFEAKASAALADLLIEARLVTADKLPDDSVALGSTVMYEEKPSAIRRTVTLVLPEEANPAQGHISVLSPIGLALIGRPRGSVVSVETAHGRALVIRILDTVRGQHRLPKAA